MVTVSIVYFFIILTVGNSERETDGNGKTTVDHEISDLKQFVTKQNHLNTVLMEKVDMLMQQNQQMTQQNQRLLEICGPHKRLLLMNQSPYEHHQTIAFTARVGSHHVTGLGNQQPIIFDDIITNVGNAYSPVTGVFTATTNGTFFFFTSILTLYNDYVEAEIVRNGVAIAATYSRGTNTHDQGSNAAALVLTQGDSVWVRHLGQEGTQVHGFNWSSFSGFQV